MSRYERTFHRRQSALETVTGNQDLLRRGASQSNPARWSCPAVICSSRDAYKLGWPPGHASLAQQPAPEATPPANHTWRSYYHAAGRRVATPARAA